MVSACTLNILISMLALRYTAHIKTKYPLKSELIYLVIYHIMLNSYLAIVQPIRKILLTNM